MKIILSSRRLHYVARISIFLVTVALIAGMGGCSDQYNLRISSSAGGTVTTPGEGLFGYGKGIVVNLVAEAEDNYRFITWTGRTGTIADVNAAITSITMNAEYSITAEFVVAVEPEYIPKVAAGRGHTVTLMSDDTVVAVGNNCSGQCDVGGWTDIVQVAAGEYHTVGLKSDGTVVAVGENASGQCDVGGWTDIVQVAAGKYHTVGLKSNGTVVTVGNNNYRQRNVGGWTGITQVAAGYGHTVGLKADGTVVAVGWNNYGQCNVGSSDIIQVAAAYGHTVGLKSDGTVVAVGRNNDGQCNVDGLTGIIEVAAGYGHTVGLKADGTVVIVGDYEGDCGCGRPLG